MSEETGNGNGNGNSQPAAKLTLTLTYDVETFQVAIGGDPIPLSLAQMMLDEAGRTLEQQRRIAAAAQMQRQVADTARTNAILHGMRAGRG